MHRWKYSVLATAAFLSAGLYTADASALSLGRLSVQSALGEPLRAEVALPRIKPAEADSLRVNTASPEVFRAQGMEYSPTANDIHVELLRRPDGSAVLRLSSNRPVNEPFVDIVLDATWSAGHLVRSYTLLLDPPALRRPEASVSAAPQVSAPAAAARAPANLPQTPRAAAASKPAAPASDASEVTVKAGDTAGKIANAYRPDGVSLDQMLVALLRANPDAFIKDNVNRLRAGAVLQMPSAADAQATPEPEARKLIAAQSHDFNAFRQRLAEAAPDTKVASADRSASGKVQTQVEEAKPAQASPDKLKLSKGGMKGSKVEAEVAKDKQADQNAERMAELSKNISQLNELNEASKKADTPAAAAASPGVNVPAPAGVPASPATPAPAAAEGTAATAPAAPAAPTAEAEAAPAANAPAAAEPAAGATEPAAATPAPPPAPAPEQPKAEVKKPAPQPAPAPEEPSFIDSLTENPLLAGGALAAILALLGLGGWRMVQNRRNQGGVDSSFLESRGHADSFFGASGGQRVDTASSVLTTGSSSMSYSPSQLDAGGDVDPVAEADVYLAYGRDLQAEEILKEALRHHPDRVSVPAKLAEIYAKRQDRKALEAVASDVYKLSNGQGPDWARVADLGRALDPDNQLYQPGGSPAGGAVEPPAPTGESNFPNTMGGSRNAPAAPDSVLPDLDLDLDLDLHEAPPAPSTPSTPSTFAAAAAASASAAARALDEPPTLEQPLGDIDLPDAPSFDPAPSTAVGSQAGSATSQHTEPAPLDTASGGLSLMDSAIAPLTSRDAKPAVQEAQEFDLGDLSLDLNAPSIAATPPATATPTAHAKPTATDDALPSDPLATKLALAEEFNSIGDSEGARALIEEVIAESSGALKERAQRLLAELS